MKIITGGVTAAKGFEAASVEARIKYQNRKDMALVYSQVPCVAAGTFTTNVVKAAPVKWDQEVVYHSESAQAVIINSGIANACTGAEGIRILQADRRGGSESPECTGEFRAGSIHRSDRYAASHGSDRSGCGSCWHREKRIPKRQVLMRQKLS